jgi:3-oxoacyl-[acyl-carrier protein] reductase
MAVLSGQTALVTGASRGVGRAVALRLGRDGARVAVHHRDSGDLADHVITTIKEEGGDAFAVQADLTSAEGVDHLWHAYSTQADRLDILVSNAGINDVHKPLGDVTAVELDRLVKVNTTAAFHLIQRALAVLADNGRVITISANVVRRGAMPELAAYALSKAGLDAIVPALAKQLGSRGITVNAVAPGVVETDMTAELLASSETRAFVASLSPLGRIARPEDIADVAGFLAGPDSRWVTGQWIDVSGGANL